MHVNVAPFYILSTLSLRILPEQHKDIHEMLLHIALEAGVKIRRGTRVSQVIPGGELPGGDLHNQSVNCSGTVCTPPPDPVRSLLPRPPLPATIRPQYDL